MASSGPFEILMTRKMHGKYDQSLGFIHESEPASQTTAWKAATKAVAELYTSWPLEGNRAYG